MAVWFVRRVGLGFAFAVAFGCSSGDQSSNAFDDPSTTGSTGAPSITTVASTIDPGMTGSPPADSSGTGTPPDDTASGTTMAATASDSGGTSTDGGPDTGRDTGTAEGTTTGGSPGTGGSSSSTDDASASAGSSSEDDGASMSASAGSTGGCMPSGLGNYADCLGEDQTIDTTVCANAAATCIVNDVADPFIGGCAVQNCVDACGCPPAPATGDAPVVCEDLTGDMLAECWLDCSGGDSCPDGMLCWADTLCLWPNADDGAVPYGDCATMGNGVCGLSSICLTDAMDTIGVCSEPCTTAADCSPAPAGGTAPVTCAQLVPGGESECHLACGAGQTCPTGMTCFDDFLCAWEV
jgi:hypothetical protein